MISIITATYNRKKDLKKLYESLKNNIIDNLEWIIVDDGSSDGTKEEVTKWIKENKFKIIYKYQNNMGKMSAINNYINLVSNKYLFEIDSDDYLMNDTLKKVVEDIKNNKDNDIYGFIYLKNVNGKTLKIDKNIEKISMFDLYNKKNYKGELLILFDSKKRKEFKYELEEKEKFITEGHLFNKMDQKYKYLKVINRELLICNYKEDGYTNNIEKMFFKYPKGYLKYYRSMLCMPLKGVKVDRYLSIIKNYLFFIYINEAKFFKEIKKIKIKEKILLILLYIPGYLKYKIKYRNDYT